MAAVDYLVPGSIGLVLVGLLFILRDSRTKAHQPREGEPDCRTHGKGPIGEPRRHHHHASSLQLSRSRPILSESTASGWAGPHHNIDSGGRLWRRWRLRLIPEK